MLFSIQVRTLDSGFWTRYGSVKSATLDSGLRTPDSGLRTPEPGLRTPDSGPGRPAVPLTKSGLRNSGTLDSAVPLSPRTPELRNSGLWNPVSRTASTLSSGLWSFEICFSHSLSEPGSRRQGSSASMHVAPTHSANGRPAT